LHGDGSQTRDFVFVADVVSHLRAAMAFLATMPDARVCNVCTGTEISVLGLAQTLAKLRGSDPLIEHGPARPGDIKRSVGSPFLATSLLGCRALTSLEAGLSRLMESKNVLF
jgi:UDP-glucose 4-epimerase